MNRYNLGFISDTDIYNHVRQTMLQYRRSINLKESSQNTIDPIKLTFDSKIYGQTIRQTVERECIRQIDKTNNNSIGYFHQYMFRYAGNDWEVPANGEKEGFDVVNERLHIYVEMKNKHNTMNAAASQKTYMKMQDKLLDDDKAVCMLVEALQRNRKMSNGKQPLTARSIATKGFGVSLSTSFMRLSLATNLHSSNYAKPSRQFLTMP